MTLFGANPVDVVVLVLVLVSGFVALLRGFTAEVLALVGWVLAVAAVIYGYGQLSPTMDGYFGPGLISNGATIATLFFGTLALASAVSFVISRRIRGTALSAVDRSLGFVFGLLRGGLFACLLYIAVAYMFPPPANGEPASPDSLAATIYSARSQPLLAAGAGFIAGLAPEGGLSLERLTKSETLSGLVETRQPAEKSSDVAPADPAYKDNAREELNRVIDALQEAAP